MKEANHNTVRNHGRKDPEADLKEYYTIFRLIGLLLVLTTFIIIAKVEITSDKELVYHLVEREVIEIEEIVRTEQIEIPPPPPRPRTPQPVPDNEIIEDFTFELDAELRLDRPLDFPPPPAANEEEEEDFFLVVEQMPELIGGLAGLQEKIRYPEAARRAGIEGRVYIQFIVNEQGDVENPVVVRGIGGGADEEALRVVSEAKFQPGMQRGRPVRVQYSLPVVFRLRN